MDEHHNNQPKASQAGAQPAVRIEGQTASGKQPSATSALVCGILSIVFSGTTILGIILGIVAIGLAGKYFKAGGTKGTGKAARICGIVGTVLSALILIGSFALSMTYLDMYGPSAPFSQANASSDRMSNDHETLVRNEQAVRDMADARFAQFKNQDPEAVAEVAALMENSFNKRMSFYQSGHSNLLDADMDITLQSVGVDPTELAKLMLDGFEYEEFDIEVYKSRPNRGELNYTLTMRDIEDVHLGLTRAMSEILSSSNDMTDSEVLAAVGEALTTAVKTAGLTTDLFVSQFEYVDGVWMMDQNDWDNEMKRYFTLSN